MADLETVLQTRLSTFAGFTALVGTRVYPLKLPQKPTMPAVTYQRIDGVRESGIANEHGMAHPRIQVDSWASSYGGAKAVAEQVRQALERWSDTTTTPVILDSFIDGDTDLYESDVELYRVSMDYIVWYRE